MAGYQTVNQIQNIDAAAETSNNLSKSQKSSAMQKSINGETQPDSGFQQEVTPGIAMFEVASSSSLIQDNKDMIGNMGLDVQTFQQMGETFDKIRWAFK